MWGGLEKILEHVTTYSTNAGKLWYLVVFVFRLIVVATVGQSVYSDEQSAFRCSTKIIGCDNVCYDKFSKISHIRFWAFQLLAVTAPAVVFHFYSLNVQGRIAKIKVAESAACDGDSLVDDSTSEGGSWKKKDGIESRNEKRQKKKLRRRRKSVGVFKHKKVFANHNLVDVTITRAIRVAYLFNVVLRIAFEAVSLYLAYSIFHFADNTVNDTYNPLSYILIKVPQIFICDGENVEWACSQHLSLGHQPGYVPCWVSRPWEKTIFMCYMNILSVLCCLLSVIELIHLSLRYTANLKRKRTMRTTAKKAVPVRSNDFPMCQSAEETDGPNTERRKTVEKKLTTLAGNVSIFVPVRQVPIKPSVMSNGSAANSGFLSKLPRPNDAFKMAVPEWVSMAKVSEEMKATRRNSRAKKLRKATTKKKIPVSITLQEEGEMGSLGTLYHSSEYEETRSSDEEQSLSSVSMAP